MLVSFNPMVTNKYERSNSTRNIAFKQNVAYDEKWLAKIIEEPSIADNEYRFHFLNPNNKISKEEYIATLTEAIGKVKVGFREGIQDAIEWAKKFKRN